MGARALPAGSLRRPLIGIAAAAATLAALPAQAAAKPITSAVITVGQGANGAQLGMSRQQVVQALGKPVSETKFGAMSYEPISANTIFDVYRDGGASGTHVRMFIISDPGKSRFKLQDGNAVFANGGMRRVFNHYGSHLRFHNSVQTGPYYELSSKFHSRKVLTQFEVDRQSRNAHVLDVTILFR